MRTPLTIFQQRVALVLYQVLEFTAAAFPVKNTIDFVFRLVVVLQNALRRKQTHITRNARTLLQTSDGVDFPMDRGAQGCHTRVAGLARTRGAPNALRPAQRAGRFSVLAVYGEDAKLHQGSSQSTGIDQRSWPSSAILDLASTCSSIETES